MSLNQKKTSGPVAPSLDQILGQLRNGLRQAIDEERQPLSVRETGSVRSIDSGVAWLDGLAGVQSEELVHVPPDVYGLAYNLDRNGVGVILLDEDEALAPGDTVYRTHRVADVPVGSVLLGRMVDALGRPLDGKGPLRAEERRAVEQPAPDILDRAPVTTPLQTGLKAIDALIPVGRGQRELIVGDRQTGKTAIAVDTIINQRETDVVSIYCAIGQRKSSVAKVVDSLRRHEASDSTIVVSAGGDSPPGLRFLAPYAATTMAEWFMHQGMDALIVYDDLTQHARAYRELSLLLRRPPGREAYPGDIFYIHSRLLERSTHLRDELGGGSLTALPIVETQAQNISAYIPTNLISITDGQVYLSPDLFQKGVLPPVDVGRSVSRVGGKTQLPAYQGVAGDLRLAYTQFTELETFARFGTRLDEETERTLRRGRHIREVLQQPQFAPVSVPEQIAVLLAASEGVFDGLPLDVMADVERRVRERVLQQLPDLSRRLSRGEPLSDEDRKRIIDVVNRTIGEQSPAAGEAKPDQD